MAQKTNLNINPYYDDFDSEKNFNRVLFKPGFPVQARELTTVQSILQNQIQKFGSYVFKDGSVVNPGGISYDDEFYAVKINSRNLGVDVSVYINNFLGKTIVGETSGVTATIRFIALPDNQNVEDLTIYVKYLNSDNNNKFTPFINGEFLYAEENVTYGNTTISAGSNFASLIPLNATSVGSAVSIAEGTYFVRGFFANVKKETIILDYYTNKPSYRIGLKIDELLVNAKDDDTLFDNAKGFANYAAPGADRLQINLSLTKKLLTDNLDTNFIELLRVDEGQIKKVEIKSQLASLGDYFAERTYEESGHYTIKPFGLSTHNSLNDKIGSDGLFLDIESTDDGNTPSDDLMCVKVSPGEAYVRGYNFERISPTILDVEKPRDTLEVKNSSVAFEFGNLLRITEWAGDVPALRSNIDLKDAAGDDIGKARFYTANLTDAAYEGPTTKWDFYVYDLQTYTKITLNKSRDLNAGDFVKGANSGATGFVVATATSVEHDLRQTSGTFAKGESLLINGVRTSTPVAVSAISQYDIRDIKSVSDGGSFTANTFIEEHPLQGIEEAQVNISSGAGTGGGGILALGGQFFNGVRIGDYIIFTNSTGNKCIVRVTEVVSSTQLHVAAGPDIQGFAHQETLNDTVRISLGYTTIKNDRSASLYSPLSNPNVSTIDLSTSTLKVVTQIANVTSDANGRIELTAANISNIDNATYDAAYDEERYSVFLSSNGTPQPISPENFSVSGGNVRFDGLTPATDYDVNATLVKNGIKSKNKNYSRSTIVDVTKSRNDQSGSSELESNGTGLSDGLIYNGVYGMRVQDEEISLNHPDVVKVIAVYESNDSNDVVLDKIDFADTSIITNAIIGENIQSIDKTNNVVARIVGKPDSNTLEVVYLNSDRISLGESVKFSESNQGVTAIVSGITVGSYKDLTNAFTLDKAQREQYYDYSRIVRKRSFQEPTRKLKIIFDHYTVPTDDNGDVFTVLSYDKDRYSNDIPLIGDDQIRATDILDLRPRPSVYTLTNVSPFDYASRDFTSQPNLILKPQESSTVSYSYYLPRIDRLFLSDRNKMVLKKGTSAINPVPPTNTNPDSLMEIGTINLPPYLYDPNAAIISLIDNRRYTMRDIGALEDRIETLEEVTSLSLLELNTENLQITDALGNNRFKTGFFADDFKGNDFIDDGSTTDVDPDRNELRVAESRKALELFLVPEGTTGEDQVEYEDDYNLLDSNTKKTGDSVTLSYTEKDWIAQPLATRVENVNPFHVIQYNGVMRIRPLSDSWTRTIRASAATNVVNRWIANGGRRGQVNRSRSNQDVVLSNVAEQFIRRSNIYYFASNLKPLTQFFQFFDGNGSLPFVPKLIEISPDSSLSTYGSSGAAPFQTGENVRSYDSNGNEIGLFKAVYPDHKRGPGQNRNDEHSQQYNINPYIRTEGLPQAYSQSSKVLNISMAGLRTRNNQYGYAVKGGKLLGETSGAEAYVKDLRLISDNYGDLAANVYIKDPHATPTPAIRITTGTKTLKITNSETNEEPLRGSKLICTAEGQYTATGRVVTIQNVTTVTETRYFDPLAQTFIVGGDIEAPDFTAPRDDDNGVFLTAVDLFFATKPSGNDPLRVEIRTVELGTVTRDVLGIPAILTPNDITTSRTGEIATKVTFEQPIYLPPNNQYAITLIADTTDQYEVWIAEMGERTVNTQSLPDAEAVIYSKQFALGRLYKSQNGAEWTPNDYQDMKFKLYKAEFTTNPGVVYFTNPTLSVGNEYQRLLIENPIESFSKTGKLVYANEIVNADITPGRKIYGNSGFGHGIVTGVGNSVASVSTSTESGGFGYSPANNVDVDTFALTGSGTGLRINITGTDGTTGAITGVGVVSGSEGTGYVVGDIIGITTTSGKGAFITIDTIESGFDTIYLNNIQGTIGGSASNAFNTAGTAVTYTNAAQGANQTIGSGPPTSDSSFDTTGLNSGNVIRIEHQDHGMYFGTNKVNVTNVGSDVPHTTLTTNLSINDTSSISVTDASNFTTFEGLPVGTNNHKGYLLIGDEVIEYGSVSNNTIGNIVRGKDSDRAEGATGNQQSHLSGATVSKYEFNGVSLRRINKVHDIADSSNSDTLKIGADAYYLLIPMDDVNNGGDRSSDDSSNNIPALSFTQSGIGGGTRVRASENIMFDQVRPAISTLTPSELTTIQSSMRSISGSSIDGTEVPFLDQGFEPIELDTPTKLNSVRLVASEVNEKNQLDDIPRNKSLTFAVTLQTSNKNISPIINLNNANVEFISSVINKPVSDYTTNREVHTLEFDPHTSIYLSNRIDMTNASTSLKVIVGAYRPGGSDFRVLYELFRPDSAEVRQRFELFPGYDNLTLSNTGDLVTVDPSKNSGLPDEFVPDSLEDEFREYEFTANNLPEFTGYRIKIVMSGTDQANPPRFKDLRTIALA